MYPSQSYLDSCPRDNARPTNGQHDTIQQSISNRTKRFSCSIHNCLCKRAKIGLVLYAKDIQMKNVILLVCDQCYSHPLDSSTPHGDLETWYFNIYKDSKSFQFKSRFLLNEDGSFSFHNVPSTVDEEFTIKERELEKWEKDVIQQMVNNKL